MTMPSFLNDTEDTEVIVCPHCGFNFDFERSVYLVSAGESEKVECTECEKPFNASCEYGAPTFSTDKLEDNEST